MGHYSFIGMSKGAMLSAAMLGLFGGIGAFTFNYAEGFSYARSDPKVCVNCHIMQQQFDSWEKSRHHAVAGCVDCHLPHALIPKYIAKGENGYHHSKAFTLQNFHEPIIIKKKNSDILQENCLRCHEGVVHEMAGVSDPDKDRLRCVHCHRPVGHGEPAGVGGSDRGEENERKRLL